YFAGTESVVRELSGLGEEVEFVVLDVHRLDEVSQVALDMLRRIADQFTTDGRRLILVDPAEIIAPTLTADSVARIESRDLAIARCENQILVRYGTPDSRRAQVPVMDSPALSLLETEDITALTALMHRRSYADGDVIRRVGQRFGGVF